MFVPVGLAWSKGAAQGGIRLFSTVHIQPNILLRRGTKQRKKNECKAGRGFLKVAKERACTEIVPTKPFVLSLLLPHHFLLGKRRRENQYRGKSLTPSIRTDQKDRFNQVSIVWSWTSPSYHVPPSTA